MIFALLMTLSVPMGTAVPQASASAAAGAASGALFDGAPLQTPARRGGPAPFGMDLAWRESLPQTEVPRELWETCCGSWGPRPSPYPEAPLPEGSAERSGLRQRVVEVARRYIGLPYLHRHIPGMGGLDCSNFTSWVYNFGFGIFLDSNIRRQSETAGRRIEPAERLEAGDLLFLWDGARTRISHVAIYIDESSVIDSAASGGVAVREFSAYRERLAWARRVF